MPAASLRHLRVLLGRGSQSASVAQRDIRAKGHDAGKRAC